ISTSLPALPPGVSAGRNSACNSPGSTPIEVQAVAVKASLRVRSATRVLSYSGRSVSGDSTRIEIKSTSEMKSVPRTRLRVTPPPWQTGWRGSGYGLRCPSTTDGLRVTSGSMRPHLVQYVYPSLRGPLFVTSSGDRAKYERIRPFTGDHRVSSAGVGAVSLARVA